MLRSGTVRNQQQLRNDQQQLDNEEGMRYVRDDEDPANRSAFDLTDKTPIGWKHLVFVLAVLFILKVGIHHEVHRLPKVPDPTSLGIANGAVGQVLLDTEHFVAARTRKHLNRLTGFGIRLAGGMVTDSTSVKWLLSEFDDLRSQLGRNNLPYKLSFTHDLVSGFFELPFLSGFTSVYSNISNVLARLDPITGATEHALLINCHFDSYFETVGASDDAVNCALMLEVLRALMSSKTHLENSIVFLFNGAEESILQASHGFVAGSSQVSGGVEGAGHQWMKHIRAFVNLEAAGAGGKEVLFQSGPGPATANLLRAYGSSVPYPFASVLGQEVFQSGIIPSDTDFRIFRDHGHLPGFDFAFFANGFVYHTKYDSPDRISDECLQCAGENLLALVRKLASSDLASLPPVVDPNDNSGEKLVFFDLFSSYFVVFPFRTVGLLLNSLAVGGTIWRVVSAMNRSNRRDAESYRRMLFSANRAHLEAITISGVVLFLIATLLSHTSSCMSWYSQAWLLVPFYVLPAVFTVFIVHAMHLHYSMLPKCSGSNLNQNCERIYGVSFDAALVLCSIGIVILTVFGIASSYILTIWVGLSLLSIVAMDRLIPIGRRAGKKSTSATALLFRHFALTLLPTIYQLYITDAIYEIFVPILGRTGGHVNPEYFIEIIILSTIALQLMFHGPLVYLTGGRIMTLLQLIAGFSGFVLITVLLTPFGNPYSMDAARYDGAHAQRSVTGLTMQRIVSVPGREAEDPVRSGIWFIPLDYNGISPLRGYSKRLDAFVDKARIACTTEEDPKTLPYCGLPYVFPVTQFVGGKTWWIDVETPSNEVVKETHWPIVSQVPRSPMMITAGRWLLQFKVDCGDTPQCALYISPQSHAVLLGWYFTTKEHSIASFPMEKLRRPPGPTDSDPRPTWFVMLRFGSSSELTREQQRSLIVTLEVGASGFSAASGKFMVDFAVANHYFRNLAFDPSLRELPQELRAFTTALPPWHYSVPLTSLYASYSF